MITKRDLYEIHSEKICPYTGMASPEFAPLSAGISYRDPYYHIRRFNGDHYVFECVLQGTGYVEFNGTLTRLTAGDAYILHPCTFHHYYSDHNDPWVKIWFNGQGNLISHLLSDYQLGFNCCVRNFWKSDYLMQILQKLEKEPSLNKNELALLLHQHIIQFSEQFSDFRYIVNHLVCDFKRRLLFLIPIPHNRNRVILLYHALLISSIKNSASFE